MLTLHNLKPNKGARKAKRIRGRGDGSGRGTYSGKGGKGQTARTGGKRRPGFEGGQTPLIRRMPKLKGFTPPNKIILQGVNVGKLNGFDDGTEVDIVALYENKLISRKNRPVKILGDGELEKKLTLKVYACSSSAQKKIEAKGGKVILSRPAKSEKVVATETETDA